MESRNQRRIVKAVRALLVKWCETRVPRELFERRVIEAASSDAAAMDAAISTYIIQVVFQLALHACAPAASVLLQLQCGDKTLFVANSERVFPDAKRTPKPNRDRDANEYVMPYVAEAMRMYTCSASVESLLAPLLAAARVHPATLVREYENIRKTATPEATLQRLSREREFTYERYGPLSAQRAVEFAQNVALQNRGPMIRRPFNGRRTSDSLHGGNRGDDSDDSGDSDDDGDDEQNGQMTDETLLSTVPGGVGNQGVGSEPSGSVFAELPAPAQIINTEAKANEALVRETVVTSSTEFDGARDQGVESDPSGSVFAALPAPEQIIYTEAEANEALVQINEVLNQRLLQLVNKVRSDKEQLLIAREEIRRLQEAKAEYDTNLRSLYEDHQAQVQQLSARHEDTLKNLETAQRLQMQQKEESCKEAESRFREQERALVDELQRAETQTTNTIKALQQEFETRIQELRVEHDRDIEQLRETHAAEARDLRLTHDRDIQSLKQQCDSDVEKYREELQTKEQSEKELYERINMLIEDSASHTMTKEFEVKRYKDQMIDDQLRKKAAEDREKAALGREQAALELYRAVEKALKKSQDVEKIHRDEVNHLLAESSDKSTRLQVELETKSMENAKLKTELETQMQEAEKTQRTLAYCREILDSVNEASSVRVDELLSLIELCKEPESPSKLPMDIELRNLERPLPGDFVIMSDFDLEAIRKKLMELRAHWAGVHRDEVALRMEEHKRILRGEYDQMTYLYGFEEKIRLASLATAERLKAGKTERARAGEEAGAGSGAGSGAGASRSSLGGKEMLKMKHEELGGVLRVFDVLRRQNLPSRRAFNGAFRKAIRRHFGAKTAPRVLAHLGMDAT